MNKNYCNVKNNVEVKYASPWVIYYRKLEALFGKDPDIRMSLDETTYTIRMMVDSTDKADALAKLLPAEKEFGNITVKVIIIPPNNDNAKFVDLISTAFKGNPAVNEIVETEIFDKPFSYVLFDKDVVQYPNDDIGDYFSQCSTLYQDLAKDLIGEEEGVHFCTDRYDKSPFKINRSNKDF